MQKFYAAHPAKNPEAHQRLQEKVNNRPGEHRQAGSHIKESMNKSVLY